MRIFVIASIMLCALSLVAQDNFPKGLGIISPPLMYGEPGYPGDTAYSWYVYHKPESWPPTHLRRTPQELKWEVEGDPMPLEHRWTKDAAISGYGMYYLQYYERQGDWIKVFEQNPDYETWLKVSELEAMGFEVLDYMSWLLKQDGWFTPLEGMKINLREGPGANQMLITQMTFNEDFGPAYLVKPTGKTDGKWAEVEVEFHLYYPCTSKDEVRHTYKGWMKVLDDEGWPNIWQYSDPCG